MTTAQLQKHAPKRCLRCSGRVRLEDVRRIGERVIAATLFCQVDDCAAEFDLFFNAETGRLT
mgnify:CR=1 FL=1